MACSYFLVKNPLKPSIINPLSVPITVISTLLNFLGFYVILKKSKKETKLFRVILFGNQFFLWLCQGFWALFANTISLFPFPALYSIGLFNYNLSTFVLFSIWIVLSSIFAVFMISLLVIRHKMVVRPESFWNCPKWFYLLLLVGGWVFCLSVVVASWLFCYSPEMEEFQYVTDKFPECMQIFQLPGVIVFTNVYGTYMFLTLVGMVGIATGGVYIVGSCLALYELSAQTRRLSKNTYNHHKKIVIDTTVQIVIKSIFLSTWAFWLVASYFLHPEFDTTNVSIVINSLFVAAPIPGTIALLIQNTVYRNFLIGVFRKTSDVNPSGCLI